MDSMNNMKIRGINIKIILSISLVGSIISSIFIGILITSNPSNPSWNYHLTDNMEEQNSGTSISSNGEYMVVGSGNDYLYLFKNTNSSPLWSFRSFSDVPSVDISIDSNFIISGDSDGIARLFDRGSSIPLWNLSTGNQITSVDISSDGDYSLISCDGKKLYLYQRSTSTLLFNGTNAGDRAVISSNGDYIASFDYMVGDVYFFNKSSSTPMWQYSTGDVLTDIALTPNGEFIVTGGQAHEVYLFNKSNSTPKILDTEGNIRAVGISQDGSYIAVGCADGVYLFNASSLTRLWKYSFPIYGDTHSIAISSNGDYIVADLWRDHLDGEIKHLLFFNKFSNSPLWTLETEGMVNEVDISSDGDHISVVTQRRAYYINSRNPFVDDFYQLKLNISFISLGSFIGSGLIGSLIYAIMLRIEKTRIEKEKREKEVLELYETLDAKYQEWEDKESEEESKI